MKKRLTATIGLIEHKGVDIFLAEYRNLTPEEFAKAAEVDSKAIADYAEAHGIKGKELFLLPDVQGVSFFSGGAMGGVKGAGKMVAGFLKATAAVGDSRATGWALNIFGLLTGSRSKQFDNLESAKDWLAEQASK